MEDEYSLYRESKQRRKERLERTLSNGSNHLSTKIRSSVRTYSRSKAKKSTNNDISDFDTARKEED